MTRRILLLLVTSIASVVLFASPVSAHNTLLSSDPADGAVLDVAPTQLTLVFAKAVPLDTLSIEIIDATGVRSDLVGSAHGPNGGTEVLTPLPAQPSGEVTLRWRLVGPDGHPITGRISFTIPAAPTTILATPIAPEDPAAAQPAPVTTTAPPTSSTASTADGFDEPWTTPDGLRWLLRFGSYLAIMAIGGVIATTAFVWRRAWGHPLIRRSVVWALASVLVAAITQLLVIASDIRAAPPWAAASGMSAALETDAGRALAIRIALVVALAWVMFMARTHSDESRWKLSTTLLLGLLATWAYSGHSRSMRWSLLGVPLDVAHHAAAAAWIGGLAIIGLVAIRESDAEELIDSVSRFARLAATSVALIVGTGVLQAIRLVGSPGRLFAADHGKYLVLKLLVLGLMLKVADINRQRVSRRFRTASTTTPLAVNNLRRAMGTELAVGLVVVAVTAAMVVSPPAVAQEPANQALKTGSPTAMTAIDAPTTATTVAPSAEVPGNSLNVDANLAVEQSDSATVTCAVSGLSLQLGASGTDVECLQGALRDTGFLNTHTPGAFDDATDAAVRELQAERGLVVDGIVGQVTGNALGIWSG